MPAAPSSSPGARSSAAGDPAEPPRPAEGGRRRLVLVAVVAAAAVFLVASVWLFARRSGPVAQPPGETVETGPGAADDVTFVGDSITELSETPLRQALGDAYRLRFRARGGYRIDQLEPYVVEVAATRPEQVVLNLGTNDVLQGWPLSSSVSAMGRMLDDFRDVRCVAVVTVNEHLPDEPGADPVVHDRAVALNGELRRLAAAHGAQIVDWAAAVDASLAGDPAAPPLTADGTHPSEAGQAVLVGLYRDALDRCPR